MRLNIQLACLSGFSVSPLASPGPPRQSTTAAFVIHLPTLAHAFFCSVGSGTGYSEYRSRALSRAHEIVKRQATAARYRHDTTPPPPTLCSPFLSLSLSSFALPLRQKPPAPKRERGARERKGEKSRMVIVCCASAKIID